MVAKAPCDSLKVLFAEWMLNRFELCRCNGRTTMSQIPVIFTTI